MEKKGTITYWSQKAHIRGSCGEKKRLKAGEHLQELPQELRDSANDQKRRIFPRKLIQIY